jgi:hypothetical protein
MRQPVVTAIPYLSANELACKGSGVIRLDPLFVQPWVRLREKWGKPLMANSVCRTTEHNRKVGGNPNSLHLTTNQTWPTVGAMAIDVDWHDWPTAEKLRFSRLAWSMDWAVGLHNSFCHIDRRADLNLNALPQSVFLYGTWSGEFSREYVKIMKT